MKNLFANHEKKYFKTRNPKNLPPSRNSATIRVSSCRRDTGANEKFVWGDYEAAFNRAKEYLITPVMTEVNESDRFRLEWH